jgi:hypothetical protein
MGDVQTANRTFLRARLDSQMLIDPTMFFAIGNGTGKTLQLETGSPIDIGVGSGQFMEVNGFNGDFSLYGTNVLKRLITQAASDSIADITVATGGGPPIKALRALTVTAGAAAFLGTYVLAPVGSTTITAGGNLAVGVATISDDGKTIVFPAGTLATAVTIEYSSTIVSGDASRIAQNV